MLDKEQVKNKLINQGYNDRNAGLVAEELMNLSPELVPCLEAWMEGKQTDYVSNDYSIIGLMKDRRMTCPAAILTMDWIIKEPEQAIKSLKRGKK